MSEALDQTQPVNLSAPGPSAERDAAIAMLQGAGEALDKAGGAKPPQKGGKTNKAPAAAPAEPEAAPEAAAGGEGAEPAEEATEAEPEAEEAKAPEAPKTPPWKAYERKKAALREERAKVEAAKAEVNSYVREHAPLIEAGKHLERLKALASSDPVALLEAFGLDYGRVTSHVLQSGSPDAKLEQLERQLKQREEQDRTAQQRAVAQRAEHEFLSIATKADTYPDLTTFAEVFGAETVVKEAYDVAHQLTSAWGRSPSDAEIASELDRRAGIYHSRVRGVAHSTTPARSPGPGERAKSSVTRAPTTISQQHASESSGKSREDTEAERIDKARALLASGLRKR